MALDELKDDDYVEHFESFQTIVAKEISENIPEIRVDYIADSRGKGFSISTGSGGCGDGCNC
ncbi:MAG: hypothetical protein ACOYVK_22355 [Bacillota bacterium]